VSRGNLVMVQLLLLHGASIDAIDYKASLHSHPEGPCPSEISNAQRLLVSSNLHSVNLH